MISMLNYTRFELVTETLKSVSKDIGLRIPICSYNANIRDQVRRIYLQKGPCQPSGYEFPKRKFGVSQFRRFNPSWFKEFGDWLEYSIEKDAAYCLYCYLFKTTKGKQVGGETFVSEGFTNWKGKDRLNIHVGQHDSEHHKARMNCEALMNQDEHIQSILHKQSKQMRNDYRIRLNASIDCIRVLLRQGNSFRGHDETRGSLNPVDESRDVSMNEQMSVVLRYVDTSGHVNERFIGIEHVTSTTTLSLKAAIDKMFSKYNLSIANVRGQGFDGASNMQAVAKKNLPISNFFRIVGDVVNIVGSSYKRSDLLKEKHSDFIIEALERGEISSGRGLNQETTLQRAGDTHWRSHYNSLINLISMFSAVIDVLEVISEDDSSSPDQKIEAFNLLESILSLDFAFNLLLMNHVLGISSELSTTLQKKDQDIVNAMDFVQLLTLALILPVATATIERVFSAMRIVKDSYFYADFNVDDAILIFENYKELLSVSHSQESI
ncbi:uncharacterized protein LOC121972954 [Zingiber officinale]|uniref:uncharacterized protein LOC121972954 n=1 Tax=Zingiber officinale TaxID=94328 RepID=UPI001C4A88CC|nr:uncharacterized protein LOC121972954 [Zingiber officinale]